MSGESNWSRVIGILGRRDTRVIDLLWQLRMQADEYAVYDDAFGQLTPDEHECFFAAAARKGALVSPVYCPYAVDRLDPQKVWVLLCRRGEIYGATLADHPDFERWAGQLQPGEFWQAVGESWVPDAPAATVGRGPMVEAIAAQARRESRDGTRPRPK